MAFLSPPSFPLTARVWNNQLAPTPIGAPDFFTVCSVSPISPTQWTGTEFLQTPVTDTIIRMPKDSDAHDSWNAANPSLAPPYTLIEAPSLSGNIYRVVYSHIVGRGHPNEFRRLYCGRTLANWTGPAPP